MKNVDIVRIDLSGEAREGSGGSEMESREMWPAFWKDGDGSVESSFEDDLEESSVEGMAIQNIDFVFWVVAFLHPSRMGISEFHPHTILWCRSSSNSASSCRLIGMSWHFILGRVMAFMCLVPCLRMRFEKLRSELGEGQRTRCS